MLLQVQVGIKQRRHRENIAAYINRLVQTDEALGRFVTLSVEGNISAGKSTFLNGITAHCPDLQELVHVSLEARLLDPDIHEVPRAVSNSRICDVDSRQEVNFLGQNTKQLLLNLLAGCTRACGQVAECGQS